MWGVSDGTQRNEVGRLVESVSMHARALFGESVSSEIGVYVASIRGPIRGFAGEGFVVVDVPEVRGGGDCSLFLSSAGVDGTFLPWVLAHEVAHQWFGFTALVGDAEDRVAWEGAADYVAFDWWRSVHDPAGGSVQIRRLIRDRIALAPEFAESHQPGRVPSVLSDRQERALLLGRGSAGWLKLDAAFGRDVAVAAARRVVDALRGTALTTDEVLRVVGTVSPEAALELRRWWLSPSLGRDEWQVGW